MNTHNVNTAVSESFRSWVNGQVKQPESTAPEMVFFFRDTGKIYGMAIELDGEWISLSGEKLSELQVWSPPTKPAVCITSVVLSSGRTLTPRGMRISCTSCRRWT